MIELPDEAARMVAKGVAAYLRASAAPDLPPALAALKKTVQSPKALGRQRDRLLAVLEEQALRALILEWLEEGKPALAKPEVEALRLASERPEGWVSRLSERAAAAPTPMPAPEAGVMELERKLEREKEAHRKARDEVKRTKEAARSAAESARSRSARLDEEVAALKALVREREADLRESRGAAERAAKDLERTKRKARSDLDAVAAQLRTTRDETRALKKKLAEVERDAAARRKKAPATKKSGSVAEPAGPRPVLRVPKGRFEDASETLGEWLSRDGVALVVDGYNVSHSPSGFGHLALERQRDLLRDKLKNLVNRLKVPTVLVWDGAEVAPGTKRPGAGYLTEEYSEPDRSGTGAEKDRADRHIIDLLKKMPPHPVVLVTNDRGLQDEARRERATIATSDQLLALLR